MYTSCHTCTPEIAPVPALRLTTDVQSMYTSRKAGTVAISGRKTLLAVGFIMMGGACSEVVLKERTHIRAGPVTVPTAATKSRGRMAGRPACRLCWISATSFFPFLRGFAEAHVAPPSAGQVTADWTRAGPLEAAPPAEGPKEPVGEYNEVAASCGTGCQVGEHQQRPRAGCSARRQGALARPGPGRAAALGGGSSGGLHDDPRAEFSSEGWAQRGADSGSRGTGLGCESVRACAPGETCRESPEGQESRGAVCCRSTCNHAAVSSASRCGHGEAL